MTTLPITLFAVLLIASITDIRNRKIPNWLAYGGLGLAQLLALGADSVEDVQDSFDRSCHFVSNVGQLGAQRVGVSQIEGKRRFIANHTLNATKGALGLAVPLLLLYTCGGIGGGDVKLGACIGAFTGFKTGISILFLGHILAGCFALICIGLSRKLSKDTKGIPMAVFYSISSLLIITGVWI